MPLEKHDFINCMSGGVIQYSVSYIVNRAKLSPNTDILLYCDQRNHKIFKEALREFKNVTVIKIKTTSQVHLDRILWFIFWKNIISLFTKYDEFYHHNGIYLNPICRQSNHIIIHNIQPLIWKQDYSYVKLIRLYVLFILYVMSFTSCDKIFIMNHALLNRMSFHWLYKYWAAKYQFANFDWGLTNIAVSENIPRNIKKTVELCYVSPNSDYKNHRFLFDRLEKFHLHNINLCCLGVNQDDTSFATLASQYKTNITFRTVAPNIIPEELKKYDGLVFLSSVENLPKTIFDYSAAKRPMFILKTPEIYDIFGKNNITWLKTLNIREFEHSFISFLSIIERGGYIYHEISHKYINSKST